MFEFLKQYTSTYWGKYGYLTFFLAALVLLFILEDDKKKRISFVWFPFVSLLVIYNPIFVKVVKKLVGDKDFASYYSKVYLMIPIMVVIAFAMTHILKLASGRRKFLGVLAMVLLIVASGHCYYRETFVKIADNPDKIAGDILAISDFFDEETYGTGPITLAGPLDVTVSLRAIDARFDSPYARGDEFTYTYAPELSSERPDVAKLFAYFYNHDQNKVYDNRLNAALADKNEAAGYCRAVDYIVCNKSDKATDSFLNAGCEIIGYTEKYAILKINEYPEWIVSSYEDSTTAQGMCYVLRNIKTGKLIVIDGGNSDNDELLRGVIKEAGGVVDAWFVTHYHSDHVGAFNRIYSNPDGIEIKAVYATPLDREYFLSKAFTWDNVEYFDRFLTITENAANLTYLKQNDTLEFDGLKIKVLSAYDENTKNSGSDDIANNAALVLKIEGPKKSMLLMSDCHSKAMGEKLIKDYGNELDVDYLQPAHHGNNSTPESTGFYEMVSPSIAIFDAPEWLMTGEKYTAATLKNYLNQNGCEVYDYRDGITALEL